MLSSLASKHADEKVSNNDFMRVLLINLSIQFLIDWWLT